MSLSPDQRVQLQEFLVEADKIKRFEHHFRRTDALFALTYCLVSLIVVGGAAIVDGTWRGVLVGMVFALGLTGGLVFTQTRGRRRSYDQVVTMREIAELYLLYDEGEDD